jgi:hypothetical protein
MKLSYVDHYQGIRKQARRTPRDFYLQLHSHYSFTMDGAATPTNALLHRFSSPRRHLSWRGERVFCNPPWPNIPPFIELGPTAELACFLLPARTNCGWFHRALELGAQTQFFRGKLTFDGLPSVSPIDCLLLIFGKHRPAIRTDLQGKPNR